MFSTFTWLVKNNYFSESLKFTQKLKKNVLVAGAFSVECFVNARAGSFSALSFLLSARGLEVCNIKAKL